MSKKLLVTICLVIAAGFVFTGCDFNAGTALSSLGSHEGNTSIDMPESGEFFALERNDKVSDNNQYVEVNYDGQIKFNTDKATQKVKTATGEELSTMYELIQAKDFDGLKTELKLDDPDANDFDETLILFSGEGREEVFNIGPEDLQTGENTFLPDKWDVYLTKVRRFLGALTGETDEGM